MLRMPEHHVRIDLHGWRSVSDTLEFRGPTSAMPVKMAREVVLIGVNGEYFRDPVYQD